LVAHGLDKQVVFGMVAWPPCCGTDSWDTCSFCFSGISTLRVPLVALGIVLPAASYVAGRLGAPMRPFSVGAGMLSSALAGGFFWSLPSSGSSSPPTDWIETVLVLLMGAMIFFYMVYSFIVPAFGAWALGMARRLQRRCLTSA
jgi:hypothetical protein